MKINNIGANGVNGINKFNPIARYNSINNPSKNEIVVVNRKPAFKANTSLLTEEVIKRFGLNMECAVKNPQISAFKPAPERVGEKLAKFFNNLEIDWRTHVDPNKKVRSFE